LISLDLHGTMIAMEATSSCTCSACEALSVIFQVPQFYVKEFSKTGHVEVETTILFTTYSM